MVEPGLTEMIHRMQAGDRNAANRVFQAAGARLRTISMGLLAREKDADCSASDLVQEAYLQKVSRLHATVRVHNREHFFSIIAHGMRQILMDRGRIRNGLKRQAPAAAELQESLRPDPRLKDLSDALSDLARLDPRSYSILRMKTDYGLTWDEIADRSGGTVWQARSEYAYAIQWLREQIGPTQSGP
jgi:RNA polymerase sigma factor (TIGR02999 family)